MINKDVSISRRRLQRQTMRLQAMLQADEYGGITDVDSSRQQDAAADHSTAVKSA